MQVDGDDRGYWPVYSQVHFGVVAENRRGGVADGTRTHDNRNHNPGLYQLSYGHRRGRIIAQGV